MVQKRREPNSLIPSCSFSYATQCRGHAFPALRLARAAPGRIALGPAPSLHRLRGRRRGVVRRLRRYYGQVRLPLAVHHRFTGGPFRCGPPGSDFPRTASQWISRFPCRWIACVREVSDHAGLAWSSPWGAARCCLPPISTASAPWISTFRGSILCPHVPLPTLRRRPRGRQRMTRGRRGRLCLRRTELPSATTCRFSRRTENVGSQSHSLRQGQVKTARVMGISLFRQPGGIVTTVSKNSVRSVPRGLATSSGVHGMNVGSPSRAGSSTITRTK